MVMDDNRNGAGREGSAPWRAQMSILKLRPTLEEDRESRNRVRDFPKSWGTPVTMGPPFVRDHGRHLQSDA